MLPSGSWKLENATAHPHSSSSNINATKQQQQTPPKAVFIRLSDELLQQLKSAQSSSSGSSSASLPAFHLELGPPSPHARPAAALLKASERESKASIPLAVNLGNNNYRLKPLSNTRADLIVQSPVASTSKTSSSTTLKLAATNCAHCYEVGDNHASSSSTNIRHHGVAVVDGKASASTGKASAGGSGSDIGERIRERAAQMKKEKDSRKIVMVEDDGFDSATGKGKKGRPKAGKVQTNLLRAGAAAKRAPTPTGSARASPSLGPVSSSGIARQPNRLIANEAAKGLMKKSALSVAVPANASVTPVAPASAPMTVPDRKEGAQAANQEAASKVHQSPVSLPTTAQISASTLSTKEAARGANAQGSPTRRQFHQMKVDAADLASASSSSEDESEPLAVCVKSPIKSTFSSSASMMATAPSAKPSLGTPESTKVSAGPQRPLAKGSLATQSSSEEDTKQQNEINSAKDPSPGSDVPSTHTSAVPRLAKASNGGPRAVAKTSGGSRLSRPLPKRVSQANVASKAGSSLSTSTSDSSASNSRHSSPAPPRETTVHSASSLGPSSIAQQETSKLSRTPSPLPSPAVHTLPPRPPPSPSIIKTNALETSAPSEAGSPISVIPLRHSNANQTQDAARLRPSPQPISINLPVNPITGIAPNIPRSPSSLQPPSLHRPSSTDGRHHSPSAASGGASPIVSDFRSRGSASPNAIASKERTTANTPTSKRKQGPVRVIDSTAKRPKGDIDAGRIVLTASSGSEEDGEAEEMDVEEGEYMPSLQDETRGRSKEIKQQQQQHHHPLPAAAIVEEVTLPVKTNIIGKGGLPSFRKKGRMSELQEKKSEVQANKSQNVSRANTPISHSNVDDEDRRASSPHIERGSNRLVNHANIRIESDAEFARQSKDFTEKLFPEYKRMYTKLEDLKESLSKGKMKIDVSPRSLAKMVEDVNARAEELQRMKDALWRYSEKKNHNTEDASREAAVAR